MPVENLFDYNVYQEIVSRIQNLTPSSSRKWGKMDVSQMLAHLKQAFIVPLSDKQQPRMFIGRLFGGIAKRSLFTEKPWQRNLPTAPSFLIKDEREFEKEKAELLKLITEFQTRGPEKVGLHAHPFFGKLTKEEWGKLMWRHLDHHLQQFGV